MAAVLFKTFCVTPCEVCCKGCSKCCSGCSEICGGCERACTYCCQHFFSDPFVCCFVVTSIFSLVVVIMAILSVIGSASCNPSVLPLMWGLVMLGCIAVNFYFSFYAYRKVTGQDLEQDDMKSTGERAIDFFYNDVGFACYICFAVFEIVWGVLGMVWSGSCPSGSGANMSLGGSFALATLSVGALILTFYLCGQCFKQMSQEWCYWLLCCIWPCLCLGWLAAQEEKEAMERRRAAAQNQTQPVGAGQWQAPASSQPQPAAQTQQMGYTAPPQQTQPGYAPSAGYPTQGYATQGNAPPAFNPNAPPPPGQAVVLNVNHPANQPGSATAVGQSAPATWVGKVFMAVGAKR